MDKRLILAVNCGWASRILSSHKLRNRFPLGPAVGWLEERAEVLVRFRSQDRSLQLDSAARIVKHKDWYYLQSDRLLHDLPACGSQGMSILLVVEGSGSGARIVVHPDDCGVLQRLDQEDPSLRLHAYDLPPGASTLVETPAVARAIHVALRKEDPELHSRRTDDFVRSPHILLALLSHVMELRSQDQIDFVSNLRCISDQLRELLQDRIVKLDKSHQRLWAEWAGELVSFTDGGMARISGFPGSEPLAIRVGVYTVVPGETDVGEREHWRLDPYVAGDIINVTADAGGEAPPPPDRKRLQEAARYILEALTVLRHLTGALPPRVLFLHGPLVNAFEMYDEGEPNFIPAIDPAFLEAYGITEDEVNGRLDGVPLKCRGGSMWNQCMAVYGYLVRRIFALDIPVVGVVERSASFAFRRTLLESLRREGAVTESYVRKLRERLDKFRVTDEMLFGCILDEGEYIRPLILEKNIIRRARDHWQAVVGQYPHPAATYLKTSPSSFPYRVEFNRPTSATDIPSVMALLYHTSLLLPEYAFPAGLSVVDRFAKVPDWMSKSVSAELAAQVLAKAVATGQPRILYQVRRLLARSPRDFFFRPQAQ